MALPARRVLVTRRRGGGEGEEGEEDDQSLVEGGKRKRKNEALRAVQEAYQRALLRRAKENGAAIVDMESAGEEQRETKSHAQDVSSGHGKDSKKLRQQIHAILKNKQHEAEKVEPALANSLKVTKATSCFCLVELQHVMMMMMLLAFDTQQIYACVVTPLQPRTFAENKGNLLMLLPRRAHAA
eukprot:766306-Hanusia_phi.AAC.3